MSHYKRMIIKFPLEIWMIIFTFIDTDTFNAIITYLYCEDRDFTESLYKMVCMASISHNKQCMMMSFLVKKIDTYRTVDKYIHYKMEFICDSNNNKNDKRKSHPVLFREKNSFKSYIVKHKDDFFKNDEKDRNFRLFMNLTRYRFYEETNNHDNIFKYYTINLPVSDVVRYSVI